MASDTIKGDDEDDEGTLDFTLLELDAMADEILTDSPGRQSKHLGGWKSEGRRELRLDTAQGKGQTVCMKFRVYSLALLSRIPIAVDRACC